MSDRARSDATGHTLAVKYQSLLKTGVLQLDPAQSEVVNTLQYLAQSVEDRSTRRRRGSVWSLLGSKAESPLKGLYLVGDVGRGKTMLMDLFFDSLAIEKKRRIHFHVFMQEVLRAMHAAQRQAQKKVDPVQALAAKIARSYDVLCFDEFQINDMSDAVLVLRLLVMIMQRGTVVVTTSNTLPADLMSAQPQNKATMRPFINKFVAHFKVMTLEAVKDYRRGRVLQEQRWQVPVGPETNAALRTLFDALTAHRAQPGFVRVGSRQVAVPLCAGSVAWFDFDSLFGAAYGPADYLALVGQFRTLFVEGIPVLVADEYDKARRFITLIDIMYENQTSLYATAACQPESLYQTGENARAFERTISRLEEMRSEDWARASGAPVRRP